MRQVRRLKGLSHHRQRLLRQHPRALPLGTSAHGGVGPQFGIQLPAHLVEPPIDLLQHGETLAGYRSALYQQPYGEHFLMEEQRDLVATTRPLWQRSQLNFGRRSHKPHDLHEPAVGRCQLHAATLHAVV